MGIGLSDDPDVEATTWTFPGERCVVAVAQLEGPAGDVVVVREDGDR